MAQSTPRGLRPSKTQTTPQPTPPTQSETPSSTPSSSPTPEEPSPAISTAKPLPPIPSTDGVEVKWFGHSFVYFITRSGVRIAIDPFTDSVKLPFPRNLQAEVALISYESDDRGGGERLNGAPMIFRGITGLGVNRAGGILFRGVESWRDSSMGRKLGINITYSFELDGVRFCHLGGLGHPLTSIKLQDIGRVDVLFVPAGNLAITPHALWELARKMNAKWVVPIAYQNTKAGLENLRPLDDFLRSDVPVVKVDSNVYHFTPAGLPKEMTTLILKSP